MLNEFNESTYSSTISSASYAPVLAKNSVSIMHTVVTLILDTENILVLSEKIEFHLYSIITKQKMTEYPIFVSLFLLQ